MMENCRKDNNIKNIKWDYANTRSFLKYNYLLDILTAHQYYIGFKD